MRRTCARWPDQTFACATRRSPSSAHSIVVRTLQHACMVLESGNVANQLTECSPWLESGIQYHPLVCTHTQSYAVHAPSCSTSDILLNDCELQERPNTGKSFHRNLCVYTFGTVTFIVFALRTDHKRTLWLRCVFDMRPVC